MKPVVLAFAGSIASGKSTLSKKVAEILVWPRVGFGDYVRAVARDRGLNESRETLQNIGASLVTSGIDEFCRGVLAQANWERKGGLVIDGIRHAEVINSLQKIVAPLKLFLIFVSVDETTREVRLQEMGITDPNKIQQIENHSTEEQVKISLAQMANLTVDGTRPVLEGANQIIKWLKNDVLSI